jgi:hypothetical protein
MTGVRLFSSAVTAKSMGVPLLMFSTNNARVIGRTLAARGSPINDPRAGGVGPGAVHLGNKGAPVSSGEIDTQFAPCRQERDHRGARFGREYAHREALQAPWRRAELP